MRTALAPALAIAWLLSFDVAGHGPEVPRGSGTATYFACEPGFLFEARGDAARCRRVGSVLSAPMRACPQGDDTVLSDHIDYAAAQDMCVGMKGAIVVSTDRLCPPDYTKRVVGGLDRCERPIPEMVRAPSVPVAR